MADDDGVQTRAGPKTLWRPLIVLLAIYFLVELPFLSRIPGMSIDEPWYFSIGHSLLTNGTFLDAVGESHRTSLLAVLEAAAFYLLGSSLFVARLTSVLGGMLGVVAVVLLLRQVGARGWIILACGLAYIFSNEVFFFSRTLRPEAWVLAMTAWGVYELVKFVYEGGQARLFGSAVFFALAFLFHPSAGILAALAGMAVLALSIQRRNAMLLAVFVAGGLLVAGVWLVFLRSTVDSFWALVGEWSARTSAGDTSHAQAGALTGLADRAKFFLVASSVGYKRVFILAFEFGILILGLLSWRKHKPLAMLSLGALAYFVCVLAAFNILVLRYFAPLVLASIVAWALIWQVYGRARLGKAILLASLGLLFLNSLAGDVFAYARQLNNTDYAQVERELATVAPPGSTVVSQLYYYIPFRQCEFYVHGTRWHKIKKFSGLEELLRSGQVDFVVLSGYDLTLTQSLAGDERRVPAGFQKSFLDANKAYYDRLLKFASEGGSLTKVIKTNNYGDIQVWKMEHRGTPASLATSAPGLPAVPQE